MKSILFIKCIFHHYAKQYTNSINLIIWKMNTLSPLESVLILNLHLLGEYKASFMGKTSLIPSENI